MVESLVADVAGESGGLPLLSTTLLELWRTRAGHTLRHESYLATGGVSGAVARFAEDAYSRLSESDRRVARGLMLRLASGEGPTLARRRVALAELERIDGADRVQAVLIDARLLTVSQGEVELSHEALLSEWPRYRAWLGEDLAGRRLHAHLTTSAREWDAREHDPADLYRAARLTAAMDWAAQHGDQTNALEREFIASSRREAERDARRQRSQNRRLRSLLAGVGVLLTISVIAGIIALVKQNRATSEARTELAERLGAEAVIEPRIDLAMLLAREAVNLDHDAQTDSTLLATLLRSPTALATFAMPIDARPQSVALSPDGRTLAVPDNNSKLRFYDTGTHTVQRTLIDIAELDAPVYSSDGSLLLYAGSEWQRSRRRPRRAHIASAPQTVIRPPLVRRIVQRQPVVGGTVTGPDQEVAGLDRRQSTE